MPWDDGTSTGRTLGDLERLIKKQQRPLGNRVGVLGDSIMANSFTQASKLRGDKDPIHWAHLLSNSRIRYGRNAGVSGNTLGQMRARVQSDIIAPGDVDVCVVMGGTNDSGGGVSVAQSMSDLQAIVSALLSADIRPIVCTPPPVPTTPVESPTRRRRWDQLNAWIKGWCPANRIQMVDVAKVLTDPTTGGYIAAYDGGDGIHPSSLGAKAIGQAIHDVVTPLLPPWTPPLAVFQTSDALNLMTNGLFLTDTNADGVSDGWVKTGSSTASRVTGDANIMGVWQRFQETTTNQFTQLTMSSNISNANFAIGDKVAFMGRIQIDSTGGVVIFSTGFVGASPSVNWRPISSFSIPTGGPLTFYEEYIVPPGTTAINASFQMQSGVGMDFRIGQLTILNLTALGL